ncbi:hypothetical protein WJX84_011786 [Apatococcus fuscideae]|uniref:Uncharacterized protein n=1 Tax=Apatococcus fuscideae TaxID=2026836 RepID=A0AAW1SSY5_9CHLO
MTLCDCPGLVIPKYAASKAEMVAAGVLPIDRLTDVRSPVEVVAQRIPRALLEKACGLRLPAPAMHEPQDRAPTAAEVLRTWAVARGWTAASALPDEARAGRAIMKDYVAGRLLSCQLPPRASKGLAQLAVSATPGPKTWQPGNSVTGSKESGASLAGTADAGLAEKLADPTPAPRGTMPATSQRDAGSPDDLCQGVRHS